ncbi:MAG: TetR/AcrR family transcriptional regulator [Sphingomonadaceae bacterium]
MARPKKPLISREAATSAALEVIDEVGTEAFSLGAVARKLGVKAPSLYYHFRDKAELLAEVARMLLEKIPYTLDPDANWEEQTIGLCLAVRRNLLAHPNAATLMLQFFPRHLLLESYEIAIEGYPGARQKHMAILEGIEKMTFGSTLFAAAAQASGIPAMPDFDKTQYPMLAASIAASPYDDEGNFIEALHMFIAGVHSTASGDA